MNYSLMCFLWYLLLSNVHFIVITVTSAKRTPDPEQNKACSGVSNSQHLVGEAIDIKPYGSTTFGQLLEVIYDYSDKVTPFDQLIIHHTFIRVSFGARNRHQVIDKRK